MMLVGCPHLHICCDRKTKWVFRPIFLRDLFGSSFPGYWYLKKDSFGYIHLRPEGSNRIFLTKDFPEILACSAQKSSSLFFRECREVQNGGGGNELELELCSPPKLKNQGDSDVSKMSGQSFGFNVRRGERLTDSGRAEVELHCLKTEPSLRGSMTTYFDTLTEENEDLFWFLGASDDPPLDESEPLVDVELSYFKRQPLFEGKRVRVSDGVKELAWGRMEDGRVRINLTSADLRSLDDWKSTLRFEVTSSHGGYPELSRSEPIEIGFKGRLKRGRLHGPVVIFGIVPLTAEERCDQLLTKGSLAYYGWFEGGKPVGKFWRALVGGAWLHGEVDGNGDLTGDDIAYIYPDFKTAFRGSFEKGIMVGR